MAGSPARKVATPYDPCATASQLAFFSAGSARFGLTAFGLAAAWAAFGLPAFATGWGFAAVFGVAAFSSLMDQDQIEF